MSAPPLEDRALAAARNFRSVLNALARPGRLYRAAPFRSAPAPLSPSAAAALTTLADMDAPYWLSPQLREPEIDSYARFETGAPPTARPEEAHFLFGRWDELERHLGALRIGTAEYPDRSATLVICVGALADADQEGDEGAIRVSGPGVQGAHRFHMEWIGEEVAFLAFLSENRARFPLGVDLLLTAGDQLVGLPRTARVERES